MLAWVGRTPEMPRSSPVVGSVTAVLFQSFLKVKRPPDMPNLSSGKVMLSDSWSSAPSPMLPTADRPPVKGMRSIASTISSWR